ncbi:MAG: efflux RND transporter periplasmic adaptor subunit [bacterium]|nr:efflux RND transporter periplasmic adaptor subunit [bacterium]
MAEQRNSRRRSIIPVALIRRTLGRPYLFMAAVILVIGAIWFTRLALQEFLLLDRLVNVYTNDAQVKMDTFAINPGVTAEVQAVLVKEGEPVRQGQVLVQLAQDDIQVELNKAEAIAEGIQQELDGMRLQMPLAVEQAKAEVARAEALLEVKERGYQRAQVLLSVERDRTDKMLREHAASVEAEQARSMEHEVSVREAEMTLQRTRSLFADGIISQDRLDAVQVTLERVRARLSAARGKVRQVEEHYPSGDSPQMIRVHEKELLRQQAEVKEQHALLRLARTNQRLVETRRHRLKVQEAKSKEAQAQVNTYQLKLAKTTIYSPVDGIVGYRNVEPGEMVEGDPSNPPILLIHDPRSIWIEARVWESDIRRVRDGLSVEIWIDAFKTGTLGRGEPFDGRVLRINPTTYSEVAGLPPERFFNRRERKIPVKIAFESSDPGLRAGMLAEVLILLDEGAAAQEQQR